MRFGQLNFVASIAYTIALVSTPPPSAAQESTESPIEIATQVGDSAITIVSASPSANGQGIWGERLPFGENWGAGGGTPGGGGRLAVPRSLALCWLAPPRS